MTVQKDVTKNIYVGNGSTRTFPFTFECPAEHPEYIKVYLMQDDGTALATSDYQLDMDARQITYPSSGTALPEGKKLVIMRELPLQQMMNLVNNGPYFAEDVETAFDENVMAMQQIAEKLNRSIIMSVDIDGDAFVNEVPFEAGKSFRIADDGKSITLTEDPARVLPLAQEAYAQTQAQAQSAAASATAAAKSEDSAFESAGVAGNSAQYASLSAASAAENAELTSGYKQEALTAKADATASATNAKASEANAKISENNAEASKEAAQSAATTASNFANASRSSANEARTYRDNAKNYSENVNVFIPSVSSAGVLSWTNKAGLTNPASVNIKGAKGDTGTAASITIGSVTTGAAGSNASVTNSGTASNAVLNFMLPRGKDGKDGGITVDAELSDTSTNPIQNKAVNTAINTVKNNMTKGFQTVTASIPTKVSTLENDAGYLTQHQSLAGYAKTSVANTWTVQQNFYDLMLNREIYTTYAVIGTSDTPITSTIVYNVTGAFTLNLATLANALSANQSSVFTAYFAANADYSLTISNAGKLKYVGSASDVAITSAGLLLNIWMSKDGGGTLTSIVQASKLEGGA
nr:MAG TPA: tailspike protein [Caudoviricetes sp.]